MEISKLKPWEKWYNEKQKNVKYPNGNLFDVLEETTLKYPQYIAINYFGYEQTYKEFLDDINRCSISLKSIGINKGDYVSICMPNTPEAIKVFYAVNKIGAISNMIHPATSEEELVGFINSVNSKLVVTSEISYNKFKCILNRTKISDILICNISESMPNFLKERYLQNQNEIDKVSGINYYTWSAFFKLNECKENIESIGKANDCCAILYSGGTTGNPKGIMLSNLNFNALAIQGFYANNSLEPGDSMLAVMPIFHGFGLGICIHTSFSFGMKAILQPKLDIENFEQLLVDYKPNMITGVPAIFEYLLKNDKIPNADLSFLKWVASGGDSLSTSSKHKVNNFLKKHNCNLLVKEGYGLTECVTGTCLMPKNMDRDSSIGIPYNDTCYKIVEIGTDKELGFGEIGEICINSPTVMLGYLNNEEETKKVLKKHSDGLVWFHTSDLGCIDEDGFVYYKGRIKRMIVTNGYNVYPEVIKEVIEKNEKVLLSEVVGIPDEISNEIPVLYVVLKEEYKPTEEIKRELYELCSKNISKYSIPRDIIFIDYLPKTPVGKIDYQTLVKNYSK